MLRFSVTLFLLYFVRLNIFQVSPAYLAVFFVCFFGINVNIACCFMYTCIRYFTGNKIFEYKNIQEVCDTVRLRLVLFVVLKKTGLSCSSSTHGPREPLRPAIALHFCLAFAIVGVLDRFREAIYDIVRPPPCMLVFHHPSNTILINLLSSILQTWPKSLSFLCFFLSPPLWSVFFSSGLVTDFVFPADVQYSPVAPHLEGQQLSDIILLFSITLHVALA